MLPLQQQLPLTFFLKTQKSRPKAPSRSRPRQQSRTRPSDAQVPTGQRCLLRPLGPRPTTRIRRRAPLPRLQPFILILHQHRHSRPRGRRDSTSTTATEAKCCRRSIQRVSMVRIRLWKLFLFFYCRRGRQRRREIQQRTVRKCL